MKMWDVTIRIPLPDNLAPPAGGDWAMIGWERAEDRGCRDGTVMSVTGVDELQAESIILPALKVGP